MLLGLKPAAHPRSSILFEYQHFIPYNPPLRSIRFNYQVQSYRRTSSKQDKDPAYFARRRHKQSASCLSRQPSNQNIMGSNPNVRYVTVDGGPPMGGQPPQAPPPPLASPPPPYSASVLAIPPRPDLGYVEVRWNPVWPMQPAPTRQPAPPASAPRPPPCHAPLPTGSNVASKVPPGMQLEGTYVSFPDGLNYIFPAKHTVIHVVAGGYHPWDNPGSNFGFTRHKVPCMMTVKELIGQLGATKGGDDKNGITECLECGDGSWIKGSTFFAKDDKSKQTLEALGWDETRGKERKPVWVALHKG